MTKNKHQIGFEDMAGRFEWSASPVTLQTDKTPEPHYHHHRQRLREKFMNVGGLALADYELLELLLFRALPRMDVKPLAKTLMVHFGDFNHVISADPRELRKIKGVGESVIQEMKIVEACAHKLAQTRVLGRDVVSSWEALMTYCKTRMAYRETEQFRILFLDRKNILIADEAQQEGTVDHVPVYPREVVRRALDLNASAIILVHNHPSGDPTPSKADVEITQEIEKACLALGIRVHDHVIIGKACEFSFRTEGLF